MTIWKASLGRWRSFLRDARLWVGVGLLLALILFAFVGPVFDKEAGEHYNMALLLRPPSMRHLLGTNGLGQDELAQLMIGGQTPIITGFLAAIGASVIGDLVGLLAGFGDGLLDRLLTRVTDLFLSMPQVVPVVLVEALMGASARSLTIVVILTSWPTTARIVRGRVLSLRGQPFVEAAVASGGTRLRILMRHLLPNAADDVIVAFVQQFANVVLVMAIVTFIGFGLPPPWNWASMFAADMGSITAGQWWVVVPPGVAFSTLLVSVYLVGEALRAALDPSRGGHVA